MSEKDAVEASGQTEGEQIEHDKKYSPASERETEVLQDHPRASEALDEDVDSDAVEVLPGTGGPDDPGDVEGDLGRSS